MRRMYSEGQLEGLIKEQVEGGTLENAKPMYFHPVVLVKSTTPNKCQLTFTIINNNSEAYDTFAKLKAYMVSVAEAINSTARFVCNGSIVNDDSVFIIANCLDVTKAGRMTIQGQDATGGFVTCYIEEITFSAVADGVNKIN